MESLSITAPAGATALTTTNHADIRSAFEARAGAYAAYLALPIADDSSADDLDIKIKSEETRLMADVDAAEEFIQSAKATTAREAELQLWCAISHFCDDREPDARSYIADFRYFEMCEADLDWPAKLVFGAIKSLRALGGAA